MRISRGPSWARRILSASLLAAVGSGGVSLGAEAIPLPEHPRPDFYRSEWINLNGSWDFRFDPEDVGEGEEWFGKPQGFDRTITVPFPWGAPLSGVEDAADVGWYSRTIEVPEGWRGKRIFLVIGACDWRTAAWIDGNPVGRHQGGYTPFEFEVTSLVQPGGQHQLTIRVDDSPQPFKLEGKQGYGPARGIWQTPYLEARGTVPLETLHFTPDIDAGKAVLEAAFLEPAAERMILRLNFLNGPQAGRTLETAVEKGASRVRVEVSMPNPKLWSLEDPFVYEVEAALAGGGEEDRVRTYFGMRKIGVVTLEGSGIPYIALNNRPIYLQAALDQAYDPLGYYTFRSDEFMRDEILRSRRIGLNAMRIHVKVGVPRKLYWADRLGMLIMADVPNSWGEPTLEMRSETESALRGMIRRDYNHPAIFSWVLFNETWGLRSGDQGYTAETAEWVASLYELAKRLDPSRLVEDNSPNKGDHVVTDLNSWHAYLPGYAWEERLDEISEQTYPGSTWNFAHGRRQGSQPNLNSECGNVWGYQGSTGDVDWSWDYHRMINAFRRHPRICGWLYTEHHDVINEWNGYYRYDRSEKITGLGELVEGMTLRDLHSPYYLAAEGELSREVPPGETVSVPIWASFLTGDREEGELLRLRFELYGWDVLGRRRTFARGDRPVEFRPWASWALPALEIVMPDQSVLAILSLVLEDGLGTVLHRNFAIFVVRDGPLPRDETRRAEGRTVRFLRVAPHRFSEAAWSLRQWDVLDGLKVNGTGSGHFEYRIPWPADLSPDQVGSAAFFLEASAKQLFGKDREEGRIEGSFMRGKGTHDPSLNRNAYPMTDQTRFPSAVRLSAGGRTLGVFDLADDPADHRGLLSWHSQKRDGFLREAGSYGYLIEASIPREVLAAAAAEGELRVRLTVDAGLAGGLAIYGEQFGRYPFDPTLALVMKEQ